MFYLVGIFRTSSPGGNISSNPDRTILRCMGSQIIQKFCNKRQVVWTSKKKKKKNESVGWSVASSFSTPRTVVRQAPLFMGFPRQEYCSELPFLLQWIFLTQELNLGLLHCRQILYHWSLNIKRLSFIKKTTCLKLRNLALFYVEEDARLWGSLKSFFWYASHLFKANILCFHIQSFHRAHHREWLQSDGY